MEPFRYNEDDPNPVFDDERKGWLARKLAAAEAAEPNPVRFTLWTLLGGICLFLTLRIALGPAMEDGFQSQGTEFGIGFGMGVFSFGAWWSLRTAKFLTAVGWLRRTLGVVSVLALVNAGLMVIAVGRM